jgi:hypothetical protein
LIQVGGDTVSLWCYATLRKGKTGGETRLEEVKALLVGKFPALKHVQVSGKLLFSPIRVEKTVRGLFVLPGLKVGGIRAV